MKIAKFPETIDMALDRVKLSPSSSEGFAFIGKICSILEKTLFTSFDNHFRRIYSCKICCANRSMSLC